MKHLLDLLLGQVGGQAGARELDRGRRLNGGHDWDRVYLNT